MTTDTRQAHHERINLVRRYIRQHLDEPLNRSLLADMAGFSITHFHRIFSASVGESLTLHVRRLRMERAAQQLLAQETSVTEIALASGYETHSAFGKAFKQHFGLSPSDFRKLHPTAAMHMISRRIAPLTKEADMQPLEIRTLPDTPVLYARASEVMASPAFTTANQEAFRALFDYLHAHKLAEKMTHCIALYPDEVEIGKSARFDAGAILTEDVEPQPEAEVEVQILPNGRWAVFLHVGPYDTLWQTWQGAFRDWLPRSGERLREAIPFEAYIDDPSQTPAESLRTEIHIPIE